MKRIIILCSLILMAANAIAQSPNKMSYQAVIRNSSNALITNSAVGMRISILQTSATGTAVYVETHTPITNANGLVSLEIGAGTVVNGTFASINWANGPFFIKIETDPTGGTFYTITCTSELLSVPYALYAGIATGGGNFAHYIGEEFGGGVIFHLWKDNMGVEHGLIIDYTDLSTFELWSNLVNTLIGPTAQIYWDGLSCSNAIVNQPGHTNSAAALCLNSTNGGQSDWYLPSIQEINILWNNYFTIARSLTQISGATQIEPLSYWSSTESGNYTAMGINFLTGVAMPYTKGCAGYVRAVRAF